MLSFLQSVYFSIPDYFYVEIIQLSVQVVSADQKCLLIFYVDVVYFESSADHISWLALEPIDDDLSDALLFSELVGAIVVPRV